MRTERRREKVMERWAVVRGELGPKTCSSGGKREEVSGRRFVEKEARL